MLRYNNGELAGESVAICLSASGELAGKSVVVCLSASGELAGESGVFCLLASGRPAGDEPKPRFILVVFGVEIRDVPLVL